MESNEIDLKSKKTLSSNHLDDKNPPRPETQVEQLSQEVLELYRQVNLLYRLGEIFQSGMSTEDVCRVLIKESARAVRAEVL